MLLCLSTLWAEENIVDRKFEVGAEYESDMIRWHFFDEIMGVIANLGAFFSLL